MVDTKKKKPVSGDVFVIKEVHRHKVFLRYKLIMNYIIIIVTSYALVNRLMYCIFITSIAFYL